MMIVSIQILVIWSLDSQCGRYAHVPQLYTSTLYMPWIYVSLYNNMTLVLCNILILRTLDTESLVMKSGLIHISRMVLSIMVFIQARNIILAIQ